MSIAVTIVGVSLLVVLHELGHFVAARLFGMRVLRFSIGFGPPILRWQGRETVWQIAAIPLGGYVLIDGMGPKDESGATPQDARSYSSRPVWQRATVLAAGPAMNWLLAAAFITGLAWSVGFARYDTMSPVLGEIVAGGPAAQAGLHEGDRVLRVGETAVHDWETLVAAIRAHAETPVDFSVQRAGEALSLSVTPRRGEQGAFGVIDVMPPMHVERFGPLGGLRAGFVGAATYTTQQVQLLWGLVVGTEQGRLAGLPGIVKMVSAQAERGMRYLLQSLAWLSIGLFILNLLPVPALDGSRLTFLGIEAIRRRPVDARIEGTIHGIGFLLLIGLMVWISIRDLL